MAKMIKYFFCLSLIFSVSVAGAQDTLVTVMPPVEENYSTEGPNVYQVRPEFKEFDSVESVAGRHIDQEALNRVRNDDDYWYANMEPKKKEKEKKVTVEKTNWVNVLIWLVLIGGFIALLIWLLSTSNISLLRRKPGVVEAEEEAHEENIFELNFDTEIQGAINAKNYRLAVRLMYLQVLRIMADRNIIKYTPEKTNGDYLFQLSATRYYKDFFRLTRNFDFVWYGKFPVSEESFEILKKDFFTFKQDLR